MSLCVCVLCMRGCCRERPGEWETDRVNTSVFFCCHFQSLCFVCDLRVGRSESWNTFRKDSGWDGTLSASGQRLYTHTHKVMHIYLHNRPQTMFIIPLFYTEWHVLGTLTFRFKKKWCSVIERKWILSVFLILVDFVTWYLEYTVFLTAFKEVRSAYLWRRRWVWDLHHWLPSLQEKDSHVSFTHTAL